ncbi:dienelactone hydrolase family protein [Paenibacillus sacheonensis]|uniref:Dienelactone hydrolase n=1 Tax=Paenibacillus sacheonensis TaxID=742054 RepID=A0A7X4YPA3_9BACL|nr:alpha/beta hydrolase family protein [Paenibacillus sacheonensis]MBM7565204.1 dienelactone hydrolase [Paenibacillus sacheonensis]NBC70018.1 dienelactone hydrolase [Paenibacillus sacheonensis]
MWQTDDYLEHLYAIAPEERFGARTRGEWQAWQARLRERFEGLLVEPDGKRELSPVLLESVDCGDYTRERINIATYGPLVMPVYVLIPKEYEPERGAVIAIHGHGYGSRDLVGLEPDGTEKAREPGYHKNFAVELVRRGHLVIAPELLGFGDRKLAEDAEKGDSCYRLSTNLLAMGQTMAGHRVFETLRCVDYALARGDVAADRIGCMGISGGGLVSAFAAAIDERLSAAVVSGYANTFQASVLAVPHCIDNFVPGLSQLAEMPDLLGLIAPRPLLIEAGTKDHIFPIQAADAAVDKLSGIYDLLDAETNLVYDRFEGKHEISGKVAFDWFGSIWQTRKADDDGRA